MSLRLIRLNKFTMFHKRLLRVPLPWNLLETFTHTSTALTILHATSAVSKGAAVETSPKLLLSYTKTTKRRISQHHRHKHCELKLTGNCTTTRAWSSTLQPSLLIRFLRSTLLWNQPSSQFLISTYQLQVLVINIGIRKNQFYMKNRYSCLL